MVAVLTASPTRPKVRPHVGTASSRRYERRRPEKTPLYKIVSEHLEGWLENRAVAEHPVSAHVERELRSYLTCGILCFGFGRARCTSCGQGFVVAFSCKGRGVCPSCNGRRMAQTAAHLVDCVISPVPVRQWVISVPKRSRCFLDLLADLVPPPRMHRNGYHGVFAPNHKLRSAVTAHDTGECRQAARCRGCWACGWRTCGGRRYHPPRL